MSPRGLNDQGHEALETLHNEERVLQEALAELREVYPEATITQAKELLRDRDREPCCEEQWNPPGWMSW